MTLIKGNVWLATAVALSILSVAQEARAQPAQTYVPNAADGTVSAIDLQGGTVAWTLKIGERAAHGIAASPDGNTVYAGDSVTQEVVVIDAVRRTVIKRIAVGLPVHGIDISPDGKTLWAGGQADNDPVKGTLAVINTTTLTVEDMVSPALGAASHFAFTPEGGEVWIASTSTNLVWVVDVATRRAVAAIPLSIPATQQRPAPGDNWGTYLSERKLIGLNEIAISPDGAVAYAVGPATSELFAIDVTTRRVVKSVNAGERAHGVSVSPDGREVWIADWAGVVSIFDPATLALLARIPVTAPGAQSGPAANHVAFDPERRRVYVTSFNDVAIIDSDSRQVVGRIPVGKEPHEISLEDWIMPALRKSAAAPQAPSQSTLPQISASVGVPATGNLTRTSDARLVTVEVTPLNLAGQGDTLDFRVVLDTHAVELNYDLTRLALLRDDRGNEYRPVAWQGPKGGHHVEGILKFSGRPAILASAPAYLQLRIDEIGGASNRLFRWDLRESR